MRPAELEQHIADCGKHMEAAYARYEAQGCFSDRGEADGWRIRMHEAIAMRTPAQVQSLEQARGLTA